MSISKVSLIRFVQVRGGVGRAMGAMRACVRLSLKFAGAAPESLAFETQANSAVGVQRQAFEAQCRVGNVAARLFQNFA